MIVDSTFSRRVLVGILLLLVSLILNYFANQYISAQVGQPARDIILDNIPIFQLDGIYLEGSYILIGFIALLGFHQPKKLPFMLKTIALFTIIRSCFFTLTHLALPLSLTVYNESYAPVGTLAQILSPGNDLFFSGHTGLPFLMALLFWENQLLRNTFLAASVIFGVTVLLARIHYSIDVFAAYFITYSIFHIGINLFKKDFTSFTNEKPSAQAG